jgi:hypothetical protein
VLIAFPYFFNRDDLYDPVECKKYPVVGDTQPVGKFVAYQSPDVGRRRKGSQTLYRIPDPKLYGPLKPEQLSCGLDSPLDAIRHEI